MTIKYPLAAALLITAASASAQWSQPNFPVSGAPSTSFGAGSVDMVEKCGTVPYRPCTPDELKERAKRSANSGVCLPSDSACQGAFMGGLGSPDAAAKDVERTAAYDKSALPDGTEWASKDCQRIPCALKDNGAKKEDPIKPFTDKAALEKAMAEAQKLMPNAKIVDLGDGRYAQDVGGGMVAIGGTADGVHEICGMPRKISDVPGLADKFKAADAKNSQANADQAQVDKSINSGKGSINAESTGGTPPPVSLANSGNTGSGSPGDGGNGETQIPSGLKGAGTAGTGGSSVARNQGADIAGDLGALGASGGTTGSTGSGSQTGGGNDGKYVKIAGSVAKAEAEASGITYTKNIEAFKIGERVGKQSAILLNDGARTQTTNVDSTIGDGKYLGVTQAVKNSP